MDLGKLVKAIAWRARSRGGYVTKTKLVKYLYLFDLAHYRRTGQILTGFPWRFHLYGPWTEDFEALYQRLGQQGQIEITPSRRLDLDAEFIDSPEHVEFREVVDDPMLQLTFQRIVDTWAARPLGEMLDYVYFRTEPMENAVRGAALSFEAVERQPAVELSQIPTEAVKRGDIERIRRAIEARRQSQATTTPTFTPPSYTSQDIEGLGMMEQDEAY